jgi:succinate dehydrogenase / fumarate reductase iron-sulfur subunit
MKFKIYRYNPETDAKPYVQQYELENVEPGTMLLAALLRIKDEQDETLSFRRSCGEGVCGSDGMNINGTNGLACITSLDSLRQPVELKPLPGLPVIRDLIIDMDMFYRQYRAVKPYLIVNDPMPEVELTQTPRQRENIDGLYECVLCACCQRPVRPSGGTLTSSSGRQRFYRQHALLKTVATRLLKNAWRSWRARSNCSVVILL